MSNTALIIASSTSSSIALKQSREAELHRCKAFIANYQSQNATTTQMQEYASCVQRVYPKPMTETDVLVLKAVLIVAFIGMVWCFIIARREFNNWLEPIFFGVVGFIFAPVGVGILVAILYAAAWLLGII